MCIYIYIYTHTHIFLYSALPGDFWPRAPILSASCLSPVMRTYNYNNNNDDNDNDNDNNDNNSTSSNNDFRQETNINPKG